LAGFEQEDADALGAFEALEVVGGSGEVFAVDGVVTEGGGFTAKARRGAKEDGERVWIERNAERSEGAEEEAEKDGRRFFHRQAAKSPKAEPTLPLAN
jgi:hypothetical protein